MLEETHKIHIYILKLQVEEAVDEEELLLLPPFLKKLNKNSLNSQHLLQLVEIKEVVDLVEAVVVFLLAEVLLPTNSNNKIAPLMSQNPLMWKWNLPSKKLFLQLLHVGEAVAEDVVIIINFEFDFTEKIRIRI